MRALAEMQGLLAVLREKAEEDLPQASQRAVEGRGTLRFEDVSFAYRADRIVLRT